MQLLDKMFLPEYVPQLNNIYFTTCLFIYLFVGLQEILFAFLLPRCWNVVLFIKCVH